MHVQEGFSGQIIKIENITEAVLQMPGAKGFLDVTPTGEVRPSYAREIKAAFLLMHWPFFNRAEESGLGLYGALMEHGKTHVVEIFFADEESGRYLGSHMTFSVEFPDNLYVEDYDPWLMEELSQKVLGVHREKSIGHHFPFDSAGEG